MWNSVVVVDCPVNFPLSICLSFFPPFWYLLLSWSLKTHPFFYKLLNDKISFHMHDVFNGFESKVSRLNFGKYRNSYKCLIVLFKNFALCRHKWRMSQFCPSFLYSISPNVGTWLMQSIAAIAVTLHKVKLLNSLAAIDCICSHTLQPTFGLSVVIQFCLLRTHIVSISWQKLTTFPFSVIQIFKLSLPKKKIFFSFLLCIFPSEI